MSRSTRSISARLGRTTCLVAALGLAAAGSASAATTIGQLAPGNPPDATCVDSNLEQIQPSVTSGPGYVVPANGAQITSWSTQASVGAGQQYKFKVWRKVGDPASYQVVANDGLRTLNAGALNTFPTNLPVQPGDVIGITTKNGATVPNACLFDSPGNTFLAPSNFGDYNVGESVAFAPDATDARLNVSAVVALKASNDFDFGKVKKNKKKGTAVLAVDVPGPGTLSLAGNGVKAQRTGGATLSKEVTKAGTVKLKVKAKGRKKKNLLARGKVKVKVKVTFSPSAVNGDVAGDPNTERKKIKLVDNG